MYPKLENPNDEVILRIKQIALADPDFLLAQIGRIAEATKINIPALAKHEIEQLISDFRSVALPPLASLPLDELADFLATHITHNRLAKHIASFATIEAVFLVCALELYYADPRNNPGRPVTVEAYAPFFPVEDNS